jgi:hypothetical protein
MLYLCSFVFIRGLNDRVKPRRAAVTVLEKNRSGDLFYGEAETTKSGIFKLWRTALMVVPKIRSLKPL